MRFGNENENNGMELDLIWIRLWKDVSDLQAGNCFKVGLVLTLAGEHNESQVQLTNPSSSCEMAKLFQKPWPMTSLSNINLLQKYKQIIKNENCLYIKAYVKAHLFTY